MARFTKKVGAATLRLEVSQSSQNVADNTSRVAWSLHLDCSNGVSRHEDATIGWNVRIGSGPHPTPIRGNGEYGFDFRTTTTKKIGEGATTFTHAADGRLTLNASGFSADTDTDAIGYPGTVQGTITLSRIPKRPGVPRSLKIGTVTATSAALSWTAPSDDGGSKITSYTVQYATNSAFTQNVGSRTFTGTSGTLSGLQPGFTYYIRVAAVNGRGTGSYTSVSSVRIGLPAPVLTGWAQDGSAGMVATWQAPSVTTGLTGYRIQVAHDKNFTSGVKNVDVGNVRTSTVTGLAGGRQYYVRVAARTAGGVNAWSGVMSAMLVLSAGDLDGWTRVGSRPGAISYFTTAGLRRGVTGTAQALWIESLSTGSVTLAAGTYGIQKTLTGLTVGKTYRFEARATVTAAPAARRYQLVVVGEGSGPVVSVGTSATSLGFVEFVADATTVTVRVMLAEAVTVPANTDAVERIAIHSITLLELGSDYGARLRETVYSSNLANHFDLAAASVGASWYVDMAGVTRFRLPGAALPVVARFTDETDDEALHYIDIAASYDTTSMANRLDVKNYGVDAARENEENDSIIVTDEDSIASYGVRTSSMAVNLWDKAPYDESLNRRLQSVLSARAQPQLLITSIRWNAQEDVDMIPRLEIGSRVTVRYRGVDQDSQITGLHYAITPTRWIVTITLDIIRT